VETRLLNQDNHRNTFFLSSVAATANIKDLKNKEEANTLLDYSALLTSLAAISITLTEDLTRPSNCPTRQTLASSIALFVFRVAWLRTCSVFPIADELERFFWQTANAILDGLIYVRDLYCAFRITFGSPAVP